MIPTRQRPKLLARAIDSVLAQSFADFEIVVVIDGPDRDVEDVLRGYGDPRLIWNTEPVAVGLPFVRATGIARSRGEWIAFLDDDDEWLPQKLETQLETLSSSTSKPDVSFSQLIARSQSADYIWPRRGPSAGEEISDYLFARNGLFAGEGLIQPSTLLLRRELLNEVPWAAGESLSRHEDWDWYLRAAAHGATFELTPQPLAVWHIEDNRPRLSAQPGWQLSFDWVRGRRNLMTKKAYSAFLLTEVAGIAARNRDWEAWPIVWREACRGGRPRLIDILLFAGIRSLSERTRERLRTLRRLWR